MEILRQILAKSDQVGIHDFAYGGVIAGLRAAGMILFAYLGCRPHGAGDVCRWGGLNGRPPKRADSREFVPFDVMSIDKNRQQSEDRVN